MRLSQIPIFLISLLFMLDMGSATVPGPAAFAALLESLDNLGLQAKSSAISGALDHLTATHPLSAGDSCARTVRYHRL